ACFKKPSSGILTPASPWTGSIRKPAVFSLIASFKAFTSPNGITFIPGNIGPKPLLLSASDDSETGIIVRPWTLSAQAMLSALLSSTPLASYAQRLGVFMAVSPASAPALIGSAMSLLVTLQIFSYHGPRWSLSHALDVN